MTNFKIPAVNYSKIDDIQSFLLSLSRSSNMFRFKIEDPDKHMDTLIEQYGERLKNAMSECSQRVKTWKTLLFKYYKMTQVESRDNNERTTVSYIYPYLAVESNETVWMLEVLEGDNYKGGIIDRGYTIDENWNCDVYLDEITQDEFLKKAEESVYYVFNRRMNRLKDNGHV